MVSFRLFNLADLTSLTASNYAWTKLCINADSKKFSEIKLDWNTLQCAYITESKNNMFAKIWYIKTISSTESFLKWREIMLETGWSYIHFNGHFLTFSTKGNCHCLVRCQLLHSSFTQKREGVSFVQIWPTCTSVSSSIYPEISFASPAQLTSLRK